MKTQFAFDLDGVVVDSYEVMWRSINAKFGTDFCPITNPMPYDARSYNVTRDDFMGVFNSLALNHQLPLMTGALETLKNYYDKTKRLVFITHRHNPQVVVKTREFLRHRLQLPYELYACHKCEKSIVAKELGVTSFVDDHPDVCQDFLEAGMEIYLFDAPWHTHGYDTTKFSIVKSWEDIARIIL